MVFICSRDNSVSGSSLLGMPPFSVRAHMGHLALHCVVISKCTLRISENLNMSLGPRGLGERVRGGRVLNGIAGPERQCAALAAFRNFTVGTAHAARSFTGSRSREQLKSRFDMPQRFVMARVAAFDMPVRFADNNTSKTGAALPAFEFVKTKSIKSFGLIHVPGGTVGLRQFDLEGSDCRL